MDPSIPPDPQAQPPAEPPQTPAGLTASLELVSRAQDGDEGALERLFERYYPRVFRVVRARMGARLRAYEAPDDIVQNTFLAALGALERFEAREDAALIDWFARLVENQLHDRAKHHGALKRDTAREVPLEPWGGSTDRPPTELAAKDPPVHERLSLEEEAHILDECIAELPTEYREAIVLRDHAAASWALVAERLGRPNENAARELHRRAQVRLMERFRQRLGQSDGDR